MGPHAPLCDDARLRSALPALDRSAPQRGTRQRSLPRHHDRLPRRHRDSGDGLDLWPAASRAGTRRCARAARARTTRGPRASLESRGLVTADAVTTTTYIFHLIPHTHWDREWYLPRAAFHARLIPMLDELIERLQGDTSFRTFLLDGQTVIGEDYLRARPEREADIKALVKTGRLQVGPWYVLADELIPSAESLIRNLLLGSADAERLGGRLDVLYSPDAFGHPAVLPTLAREFGLKYGILWRGLGGRPGQARDFFRWRGADGGGREMLLWHLPPDGYEIGAALPGAGASRQTHPLLRRRRSSRATSLPRAPARPARRSRAHERVPHLSARRVLPSGRQHAGAGRRR
ncbi:MAG: hypothetical protein DMD64_08270 [Gemmatimonadetes bacterium]|nr:MAG: hypothetical protein DMD64_08270 [Gemmatimonadota bacterium]